MPLNRTNLNRNRTLLILLGIILACLLTLNARSFSSEAILLPNDVSTERVDKNAEVKFIEKIGIPAVRHLIEKATSLEQ